MPANDILESQDDIIEAISYRPTPILSQEGGLIQDNNMSFLLRVLIQEVHALRLALESIV